MRHTIDEVRNLQGKLTDSVWRKLLKDFNCPVTFVNQKVTTEILGMSQKLHLTQGTELVVKWACRLAVLTTEEQEAFMGLTRDVMDTMIQHVLNSDSYQYGFNKVDIQQVYPLAKSNIPTGDVYNRNNIGNRYISLDLAEAAFQVFKHWDENHPGHGVDSILPFEVKTYHDWVQWTMSNEIKPEEGTVKARLMDIDWSEAVVDYVCDSKQMRQVIFGKTNPKRIQHVEKWMVQGMVELVQHTALEQGFTIADPVRLNNDEAIFKLTPEWNQVLSHVWYALADGWHVTEFTLNAQQLEQCVLLLHEVCRFQGPVVYIKDWKSEYNGRCFMQSPSTYKCLPAKFALGFEALFTQDETSGTMPNQFFEMPILVEGTLVWNSDNHCEWMLSPIHKTDC